MATLPQSTATAQLGTSAADLIAPSSGETYVVTKISLHNSDTSTVSGIKLYKFETGGSAGATNIMEDISLAASETRQITSLTVPLVGAVGDTIAGLAGTDAKVNVVIGYTKLT